MKRPRRKAISKPEFVRFKQTMQQAKAGERRQPAAPVVYHDALLRTLLVVENRGELWLCPRRPGGWSSRQRLTMADASRSERLRLPHDITPEWLGIRPNATL